MGAGHRLPVTALALSARRPFGPARFVRGLDNTIMSGWIKFAKCKSDFILQNNIPSAKYCCCYWYPQVSNSMIKPVRLHVHQLNYQASNVQVCLAWSWNTSKMKSRHLKFPQHSTHRARIASKSNNEKQPWIKFCHISVISGGNHNTGYNFKNLYIHLWVFDTFCFTGDQGL